jgi:hypothetical protein
MEKLRLFTRPSTIKFILLVHLVLFVQFVIIRIIRFLFKKQEEGPFHLSSFITQWCRRGDLNPHGDYPPPPQDGVSTNSTTSAVDLPPKKSVQCCGYAVLRCWSSNGNTAALQYSNTSLLFRLGCRHLWLNRNVWGFRRSRWSRSFFHQRRSPS